MAVLGPRCAHRLPLGAAGRGYSLVAGCGLLVFAGCGLLIAVAPTAVEHRLRGMWAQQLWGIGLFALWHVGS